MDNLTHTLVAVTLVRAGLGRRTRGATAAMTVASNAPDIDIVAVLTGGEVSYLAAHRGATHGPIGVVLLAAAVWLGVLVWRRLSRDGPALDWRQTLVLAGVSLAGAALHVLMDLPTSYGTRLLSPFAATWYAVDWLPIIEVYIWALLIGGLLAAWVRPRARVTIARVVLALTLGVYGVRAVAHDRALAVAATLDGEGRSAPCATAKTLVAYPAVIEAAAAGPGACIEAAALPTFASPFTWRLVRQYPGGYELREHSLWSGTSPAGAVWIPSETNVWVRAARRATTARVFLGFSRFTASRSAVLSDGNRRVRFVDVRFVGSPFELSQDPEARAPFVATVLVAPDGTIAGAELGR